MTHPVVSCRRLGKTFYDADRCLQLFESIDLQLGVGETLAIIGESGCGKSTLLHLLAGLEQPTAGEVFHDGVALAELSESARCEIRNTRLGFVYQFHHLLAEFSALENVAMPLLIRGENSKQARSRALEMLSLVGLADRADHRPAQLSGGERQRTAIARAMVGRPGAIFADEPTGNLDEKTAEETWGVLEQANRELGVSLLVVTHAPGLAERMDRVCRLAVGQLNPVLSV